MITFFEITAFLSLFLLLYIYVGYPILLVVLRFIFSQEKIRKKDIQPTVSLLISCYNEEDVIRSKIENSLSLEYPKDKLDILVISDASTDQTDAIVKEYEGQGVRLVRQEKRMGKTSGLNHAVPHTKGEIIVFSDANAIYQPDVITNLVRNFHDPSVGYVVGQARYIDPEKTMAGKSENLYWIYEGFMKNMESKLHSVVGGDGAIYAIRSELYEPLLEKDISDFVNPLQIILKGFRGIYEPGAVCYEEAAGTYEKEFGRKVRIVNRSFSGLMRLKSVMNPFKTGIFSFEVVSHKLLRWFAPVFLLIFTLSCFIVSVSGNVFFQGIFLFITLCISMAYLGMVLSNTWIKASIFQYPYYYVLVNVASLQGILKSLKGEVISTWNPVREKGEDATKGSIKENRYYIPHVLMAALALYAAYLIVNLSRIPFLSFTYLVFWSSLIMIGYVYIGYPLLLGIVTIFYKQKIRRSDITPTVSLLICAYNEEEMIEAKIKNCFELDYPPEKIKFIIASDGSTDDTNDIVQKYHDDRLVFIQYQNRQGKVGVINATVPKLDSEVIIFSDANTMCRQDAIRKLVRNFADPAVGGVSSDVIIRNEKTTLGKSESLYYLYERWIQKKESNIGSIIGADGGMYAIRRELFTAPRSNTILDDFVISMNVVLSGYRLVYDEEAIGEEQNYMSSKAEFLCKSRVIAGAVQSLKQRQGVPSQDLKVTLFCYISHKLLRWTAPFFLITFFIASCHLAFSSEELGYIFIMAAQGVFYGLALVGFMLDKKVQKIRAVLVPYYFCLVNGAALYGIYKGLFNKQPVTWHKFDRLKET